MLKHYFYSHGESEFVGFLVYLTMLLKSSDAITFISWLKFTVVSGTISPHHQGYDVKWHC
jgi:hypothetical protein